MKQKDLKKLQVSSEKELGKKLSEEKGKLVNLKMQLFLGKLKNVRELKLKRKEIAVMANILREKELIK